MPALLGLPFFLGPMNSVTATLRYPSTHGSMASTCCGSPIGCHAVVRLCGVGDPRTHRRLQTGFCRNRNGICYAREGQPNALRILNENADAGVVRTSCRPVMLGCLHAGTRPPASSSRVGTTEHRSPRRCRRGSNFTHHSSIIFASADE